MVREDRLLEKAIEKNHEHHVARAAVGALRHNDVESWTKPALSLYPHQWSSSPASDRVVILTGLLSRTRTYASRLLSCWLGYDVGTCAGSRDP